MLCSGTPQAMTARPIDARIGSFSANQDGLRATS